MLQIKPRCAILVGASSGIGAALALRLARAGWHLALVARRQDALDNVAQSIREKTGRDVIVRAHDVTHYDEVPTVFDELVEQLGGLEMLVYASGIMPDTGPDEYDFAKDRAMVETNLLGMIAWGNEAADFFSRLKGGTIVGIGSIAGDRGRADRPAYNTSKGAQAIYLESLRNRLAEQNVRVLTIKPGPVATPMTANLGEMPFMISANEAARTIANAIARGARTEVYVPARWRLIMLVIRHIPSVIFRRMGI